MNNIDTDIDLSSSNLEKLSKDELKSIINRLLQFGNSRMTFYGISDHENAQFISIISSVMILICIYKIEMSTNTDELSNLF
jgi:hypothetical protein